MIEILLGFVRPDSGRVTINGADITDLVPQALSRLTAWIGQRPVLFSGSIRDNILFARPEATADEVAAAATRRPAGPVRGGSCRTGLDTQIGEGGYGLSGGQAQRVAIARAYLKNAPLLLLDEPTAHLDPATEKEVLDSLRRLALGRTVILASHSSAAHGFGGRRLDLRDGKAVGCAAPLAARRTRASHERTAVPDHGAVGPADRLAAGGPGHVAGGAGGRGRADGGVRLHDWRGVAGWRAGGCRCCCGCWACAGGAALSRAAGDAWRDVPGAGRYAGLVLPAPGATAAGGLGFRQAGDVLARLVGDVEALDGLYLRILLPLAGAVLLLPVLVLLIGHRDARLGAARSARCSPPPPLCCPGWRRGRRGGPAPDWRRRPGRCGLRRWMR